MEQRWHILLLGRMTLRVDSHEIDRFPTQKMAALLAYLALHPNKLHPRDFLIALCWPDSSLESGRNNLRNALSALRRQLEPADTPHGSILVADRHHVRLNSRLVTTDVAEFERCLEAAHAAGDDQERLALLEQAAALYAGELLPGCYDEWIQQERLRLGERYVALLCQWMELLEHHEQSDKALARAAQLVAICPYAETGYRTRMRILARQGRAIEALAIYNDLVRLLRQELAIEPESATRALAATIRTDTAALQNMTTTVQTTAEPTRERKEEQATPVAVPAAGQPGTALNRRAAGHQSSAPGSRQRFAPPPLYLTRFFGREAERERLREWIDTDKRLLTITGPGGAGKTRLAVEIAGDTSRFAGGVCFVSLAEIAYPHLLPLALVAALRLTPPVRGDHMELVIATLASQSLLLVLDNMEHLLHPEPQRERHDKSMEFDGADVVSQLLARAPGVTILITSRRCLGIDGEQELPLAFLPLPTGDQETPELLRCPSVALYAERAQSFRPDFAVTDRNAGAVARLCCRLDGMPLAIEMAAAWIKTLSPAGMLERLENRLTDLRSRRSDVPVRHISLQATIEWGYNLLTPELRRCFNWLSIFRGGWTLEAATAVLRPQTTRDQNLSPPHPTADSAPYEAESASATVLLLAELQDRSFIVAEIAADGIRYRMLETLREFALERLVATREREMSAEQHASYYASLAKRMMPVLHTMEMKTALARLDAEVENLRAACDYYQHSANGAEAGLQLSLDLSEYWRIRGYWAEAREYLSTSRMHPGMVPLSSGYARALYKEGELVFQGGDYNAAQSLLEQAVELYRDLGDRSGLAYSLALVATLLSVHNETQHSEALAAESLSLFRELEDRNGIAEALKTLATAAMRRGDLQTAQTMGEECLQLTRTAGEPERIANILTFLGKIAIMQEQHAEADAFYREALALCRAQDIPQGTATILCQLAFLAVVMNDMEQAEPLMAESAALCHKISFYPMLRTVLVGLGHLASLRADYRAAHAFWRESLSVGRQTGQHIAIPMMLVSLAGVACRNANWARAATLYGAAAKWSGATGIANWPAMQRRIAMNVANIRLQIGAEAFHAAYTQGSSTNLDSLLDETLSQLPGQ